MTDFVVDINCDVGEGVGNEAQLLPLISSCNIACGAHAGDKETALAVIRLAKAHHVKIGAHPSYPDRENFGRQSMQITQKDLSQSIHDQLQLFTSLLKQEKAELNHIKAHGALYNDLAKDEGLAKCFIEAIKPFLKKAVIYAPYASSLASVADKNNIDVVFEAFADRNYNEDLSLVSRTSENALITAPDRAMEQIRSIAIDNKVTAVTGKKVPIKAETFCIHGDTPQALQILMYLVEELPGQKISIA